MYPHHITIKVTKWLTYLKGKEQFYRYLGAVVFLILTMQILFRIPLEPIHSLTSTFFLTYLCIFYLWYVFDTLVTKKRLTGLDVLLLLIGVITLISALQAYLNFGQPLIYGLLHERTNLLVLSSVLLLVSLQRKWITLKELEKAFWATAILMLIVYLFFYVLIDPAHYQHTNYVANSPLKGYVYKFENTLIIMLIIYSLCKCITAKKTIYLVSLLISSMYLLVLVQKRILLFSLLLTLSVLFLSLLHKQKIKITSKHFVRWLVILAIIAVTTLITLPGIYAKQITLISETVQTFTTGEHGDFSTSKRVEELKVATPYIKENLFLGAGSLSRQWNNIYENTFGYFYPADLGFIGTLFVYGLLGLAVLYLPFAMALRYSLKLDMHNNIFVITCKYTLLYFFISSFLDGSNISQIGTIFSLLAVIYFYTKNNGNVT